MYKITKVPVEAGLFVCMFSKHHYINHLLHSFSDLGLLNTAETSIHVQGLAPCHLIYQGVKLRAVAQVLLYLNML